MTDFVDITGAVSGEKFRFNCPHCSATYEWSAEQVVNMADDSIADYCARCGGGFRAWKPKSRHALGVDSQRTVETASQSLAHAKIGQAPRSTVETAAFQYKVVPFMGQSKGTLSASDVAKQLELTIATHASNGWEFYQLSDVNIEVQPGCIAGLFGATAQYVRFDQLIFRFPVSRET